MSNKQKSNPKQAREAAPNRRRGAQVAVIVVTLGLAGAAIVLFPQKNRGTEHGSKRTTLATSNAVPGTAVPAAIPTMDINQAVMVTVELNFGPNIPTIDEALREVERRYQPDDGVGRTFAILDAYGGPTNGLLHMSMHVSSEKTGVGALVFRRTGEVLWQSRIVNTNAAARNFTGKDLLILIDNGQGKTFTVDGSSHPTSILDANIKEMGVPIRVFWPDGAEREVTCIYSACGCPVKAMVKRDGERTARTKELPVMFPDDPAVVTLISKLMQWQ
jgi:hypothetical protein